MKKGFTLIEVIVVLAIVSIIFTFSGTSIRYYKKLNRDVEIENFLVSFKHLITEGKVDALDNEVDLNIVIENENKKIKLMNKDDEINSIDIPNYIELIKNKNINITSKGQAIASTTVLENIKDKEMYKIIIRVGVDYINIEKSKI